MAKLFHILRPLLVGILCAVFLVVAGILIAKFSASAEGGAIFVLLGLWLSPFPIIVGLGLTVFRLITQRSKK